MSWWNSSLTDPARKLRSFNSIRELFGAYGITADTVKRVNHNAWKNIETKYRLLEYLEKRQVWNPSSSDIEECFRHHGYDVSINDPKRGAIKYKLNARGVFGPDQVTPGNCGPECLMRNFKTIDESKQEFCDRIRMTVRNEVEINPTLYESAISLQHSLTIDNYLEQISSTLWFSILEFEILSGILGVSFWIKSGGSKIILGRSSRDIHIFNNDGAHWVEQVVRPDLNGYEKYSVVESIQFAMTTLERESPEEDEHEEAESPTTEWAGRAEPEESDSDVSSSSTYKLEKESSPTQWTKSSTVLSSRPLSIGFDDEGNKFQIIDNKAYEVKSTSDSPSESDSGQKSSRKYKSIKRFPPTVTKKAEESLESIEDVLREVSRLDEIVDEVEEADAEAKRLRKVPLSVGGYVKVTPLKRRALRDRIVGNVNDKIHIRHNQFWKPFNTEFQTKTIKFSPSTFKFELINRTDFEKKRIYIEDCRSSRHMFGDSISSIGIRTGGKYQYELLKPFGESMRDFISRWDLKKMIKGRKNNASVNAVRTLSFNDNRFFIEDPESPRFHRRMSDSDMYMTMYVDEFFKALIVNQVVHNPFDGKEILFPVVDMAKMLIEQGVMCEMMNISKKYNHLFKDHLQQRLEYATERCVKQLVSLIILENIHKFFEVDERILRSVASRILMAGNFTEFFSEEAEVDCNDRAMLRQLSLTKCDDSITSMTEFINWMGNRECSSDKLRNLEISLERWKSALMSKRDKEMMKKPHLMKRMDELIFKIRKDITDLLGQQFTDKEEVLGEAERLISLSHYGDNSGLAATLMAIVSDIRFYSHETDFTYHQRAMTVKALVSACTELSDLSVYAIAAADTRNREAANQNAIKMVGYTAEKLFTKKLRLQYVEERYKECLLNFAEKKKQQVSSLVPTPVKTAVNKKPDAMMWVSEAILRKLEIKVIEEFKEYSHEVGEQYNPMELPQHHVIQNDIKKFIRLKEALDDEHQIDDSERNILMIFEFGVNWNPEKKIAQDMESFKYLKLINDCFFQIVPVFCVMKDDVFQTIFANESGMEMKVYKISRMMMKSHYSAYGGDSWSQSIGYFPKGFFSSDRPIVASNSDICEAIDDIGEIDFPCGGENVKLCTNSMIKVMKQYADPKVVDPVVFNMNHDVFIDHVHERIKERSHSGKQFCTSQVERVYKDDAYAMECLEELKKEHAEVYIPTDDHNSEDRTLGSFHRLSYAVKKVASQAKENASIRPAEMEFINHQVKQAFHMRTRQIKETTKKLGSKPKTNVRPNQKLNRIRDEVLQSVCLLVKSDIEITYMMNGAWGRAMKSTKLELTDIKRLVTQLKIKSPTIDAEFNKGERMVVLRGAIREYYESKTEECHEILRELSMMTPGDSEVPYYMIIFEDIEYSIPTDFSAFNFYMCEGKRLSEINLGLDDWKRVVESVLIIFHLKDKFTVVNDHLEIDGTIRYEWECPKESESKIDEHFTDFKNEPSAKLQEDMEQMRERGDKVDWFTDIGTLMEDFTDDHEAAFDPEADLMKALIKETSKNLGESVVSKYNIQFVEFVFEVLRKMKILNLTSMVTLLASKLMTTKESLITTQYRVVSLGKYWIFYQAHDESSKSMLSFIFNEETKESYRYNISADAYMACCNYFPFLITQVHDAIKSTNPQALIKLPELTSRNINKSKTWFKRLAETCLRFPIDGNIDYLTIFNHSASRGYTDQGICNTIMWMSLVTVPSQLENNQNNNTTVQHIRFFLGFSQSMYHSRFGMIKKLVNVQRKLVNQINTGAHYINNINCLRFGRQLDDQNEPIRSGLLIDPSTMTRITNEDSYMNALYACHFYLRSLGDSRKANLDVHKAYCKYYIILCEMLSPYKNALECCLTPERENARIKRIESQGLKSTFYHHSTLKTKEINDYRYHKEDDGICDECWDNLKLHCRLTGVPCLKLNEQQIYDFVDESIDIAAGLEKYCTFFDIYIVQAMTLSVHGNSIRAFEHKTKPDDIDVPMNDLMTQSSMLVSADLTFNPMKLLNKTMKRWSGKEEKNKQEKMESYKESELYDSVDGSPTESHEMLISMSLAKANAERVGRNNVPSDFRTTQEESDQTEIDRRVKQLKDRIADALDNDKTLTKDDIARMGFKKKTSEWEKIVRSEIKTKQRRECKLIDKALIKRAKSEVSDYSNNKKMESFLEKLEDELQVKTYDEICSEIGSNYTRLVKYFDSEFAYFDQDGKPVSLDMAYERECSEIMDKIADYKRRVIIEHTQGNIFNRTGLVDLRAELENKMHTFTKTDKFRKSKFEALRKCTLLPLFCIFPEEYHKAEESESFYNVCGSLSGCLTSSDKLALFEILYGQKMISSIQDSLSFLMVSTESENYRRRLHYESFDKTVLSPSCLYMTQVAMEKDPRKLKIHLEKRRTKACSPKLIGKVSTKAIFPLTSTECDTKSFKVVNNIASGISRKDKFVQKIEAKKQFGGPRDLVICNQQQKLSCGLSERIVKRILSESHLDMLSKPQEKSSLLNLAKNLIKAKNKGGDPVGGDSSDETGWGPLHNVMSFWLCARLVLINDDEADRIVTYTMLSYMSRKTVVSEQCIQSVITKLYLNSVSIRNQGGEYLLVDERNNVLAYDQVVSRVKLDKLEKIILSSCILRGRTFIQTFTHMGQGIFHWWSSLYGSIMAAIQVRIMRKNSKQMGFDIEVHLKRSSDDSGLLVSGRCDQATFDTFYEKMTKEITFFARMVNINKSAKHMGSSNLKLMEVYSSFVSERDMFPTIKDETAVMTHSPGENPADNYLVDINLLNSCLSNGTDLIKANLILLMQRFRNNLCMPVKSSVFKLSPKYPIFVGGGIDVNFSSLLGSPTQYAIHQTVAACQKIKDLGEEGLKKLDDDELLRLTLHCTQTVTESKQPIDGFKDSVNTEMRSSLPFSKQIGKIAKVKLRSDVERCQSEIRESLQLEDTSLWEAYIYLFTNKRPNNYKSSMVSCYRAISDSENDTSNSLNPRQCFKNLRTVINGHFIILDDVILNPCNEMESGGKRASFNRFEQWKVDRSKIDYIVKKAESLLSVVKLFDPPTSPYITQLRAIENNDVDFIDAGPINYIKTGFALDYGYTDMKGDFPGCMLYLCSVKVCNDENFNIKEEDVIENFKLMRTKDVKSLFVACASMMKLGIIDGDNMRKKVPERFSISDFKNSVETILNRVEMMKIVTDITINDVMSVMMNYAFGSFTRGDLKGTLFGLIDLMNIVSEQIKVHQRRRVELRHCINEEISHFECAHYTAFNTIRGLKAVYKSGTVTHSDMVNRRTKDMLSSEIKNLITFGCMMKDKDIRKRVDYEIRQKANESLRIGSSSPDDQRLKTLVASGSIDTPIHLEKRYNSYGEISKDEFVYISRRHNAPFTEKPSTVVLKRVKLPNADRCYRWIVGTNNMITLNVNLKLLYYHLFWKKIYTGSWLSLLANLETEPHDSQSRLFRITDDGLMLATEESNSTRYVRRDDFLSHQHNNHDSSMITEMTMKNNRIVIATKGEVECGIKESKTLGRKIESNRIKVTVERTDIRGSKGMTAAVIDRYMKLFKINRENFIDSVQFPSHAKPQVVEDINRERGLKEAVDDRNDYLLLDGIYIKYARRDCLSEDALRVLTRRFERTGSIKSTEKFIEADLIPVYITSKFINLPKFMCLMFTLVGDEEQYLELLKKPFLDSGIIKKSSPSFEIKYQRSSEERYAVIPYGFHSDEMMKQYRANYEVFHTIDRELIELGWKVEDSNKIDLIVDTILTRFDVLKLFNALNRMEKSMTDASDDEISFIADITSRPPKSLCTSEIVLHEVETESPDASEVDSLVGDLGIDLDVVDFEADFNFD